MQNIIAEFADSSSQSSSYPASEPGPSSGQPSSPNLPDVEMPSASQLSLDLATSVTVEPMDQCCSFEEVEIGGKRFCLIPKAPSIYAPSGPTDIQYLEGVGPVEVGTYFIYLHSDLLPKIHDILSQSADLQEEVKIFRNFLWSKHGKTSDMPPFDPEDVKKICKAAGAG